MALDTHLPIGEVLDDLTAALRTHTSAVLVAEPGAGKTTVVPLALLDETWCTGKVIVVEPRRVAARAAASRLAEQLRERPGGTVGWRMRGDTKIGARTRIEVVTDGVLTRMLHKVPPPVMNSVFKSSPPNAQLVTSSLGTGTKSISLPS